MADGLQLVRQQATQDANILANTTEITNARESATQTYGDLKARLDAMDTATAQVQTNLDNAIAGLEWKASVADFDTIAITYPNPEEGWTVSVDDTNEIYRYDADTQTWTPISTFNANDYVKRSGDTITGALVVQGGITGDLTGNASTAVALQTARKINGIDFDGSKDITIDVTKTGEDISLTGYQKGTATAVAATDTVNSAIGKLEAGLDTKANATHTHISSDITAMTGYTKGSTGTPISTADSLNTAISKLEVALDGKSDTNHTHNYAGSTTAGGAANSAVKLETARAITLDGDITGTANFDGTSDITITTTIANPGVQNVHLERYVGKVDVTAQNAGKTLPITITGATYDQTKDVLNVYLSGVRLAPTDEYTNDGTNITLVSTSDSFIDGDTVRFEVIKAVTD